MKNKDKKEIIKIIKGKTEVTIECKSGTMEISLPPAESIRHKEWLYSQPAYRILREKFSIDGEIKSITLIENER